MTAGEPSPALEVSRLPRVIPFYVVPRDLSFDRERLKLHATALEDVRQWYARTLRGRTFHYSPIVVQHSRHTFAELAGEDFQAWWPLLLAEFGDYGLPWNEQADYKLLLLVQGAGGWAGADSENGGIETISAAAITDNGDFGGVVIIGDSSVSGIIAGVCPTNGISSGTVWWCNWDTYRGTIAHELGHTWGIPHPDAFLPPGVSGERVAWSCPDLGDTVMQCHWNFPHDSLLDYETQHFRSLRFFQFTANPQYQPLSDLLPAAVSGDIELFRMDVDRGAIGWMDGRGSGTGYPWAVSVGTGSVTWALDHGCYILVTDVGRARGAGGRADVYVIADGDTVTNMSIAAEPPREIAIDLCEASGLTLAVRGQRRFRALFGNARLVARDRQAR